MWWAWAAGASGFRYLTSARLMVGCVRRKRRQFASQDVAQLVSSEGVKPLGGQEDVFPLEIFDNTTFESRTAAEWVPRRPGAHPQHRTVGAASPAGRAALCLAIRVSSHVYTLAAQAFRLHPAVRWSREPRSTGAWVAATGRSYGCRAQWWMCMSPPTPLAWCCALGRPRTAQRLSRMRARSRRCCGCRASRCGRHRAGTAGDLDHRAAPVP
jgi:hypothetical protein